MLIYYQANIRATETPFRIPITRAFVGSVPHIHMLRMNERIPTDEGVPVAMGKKVQSWISDIQVQWYKYLYHTRYSEYASTTSSALSDGTGTGDMAPSSSAR